MAFAMEPPHNPMDRDYSTAKARGFRLQLKAGLAGYIRGAIAPA